jgi:hypothetical protein
MTYGRIDVITLRQSFTTDESRPDDGALLFVFGIESDDLLED